ncbi:MULTISPECIES: VOC family protein [Amycolatopsis]|uniref:Glyoxalase n=1 Tax=Amycolatopsis bullii TaxID=941987 RepID=A0ABQ3KRK3_9PSEU|nr:VOC family protein [Amycolatopsis bullii]GHG48309.1 glyoxalase [Amycolatopsis bullii]
MAPPFVFFDIRTSDVDTVRKFYTELFGWSVADVPAGEGTIPLLMGDEGPWGGFTELAEGDERLPQWVPYVPVEDVDAATEKATGLGATVIRPRMDLPFGSLVVITDPTGATLVLLQAKAA